ncbi:MAG: hypothetical protein JEZ11_01615 [Desulfobacterales bacterium]|nr:hypothetical protein [Desulfobacterales bacterium]
MTLTFHQIRQEKRHGHQNLVSQGNYLISLLALYPMEDYQSKKRDFFLRTLAQYAPYDNLVYFLVHDQDNKPLVSMIPGNLAAQIPQEVSTRSVYTMGMTMQAIDLEASTSRVWEFSRPIMDGGTRVGTVRLGLKGAEVRIFSLTRLSQLGLIALFMMAAASLSYFGVALSLNPLKHLQKTFVNTCLEPSTKDLSAGTPRRVEPMLTDMHKALGQIKGRLSQLENDKLFLAARLDVSTYEKQQVERIFDAINFGIIVTDVQDNICMINRFMLYLLKTDRTDVIDRPMDQTFTQPPLVKFLTRTEGLDSSRTVRQGEMSLDDLAPDELFQVSALYLVDDDGTPTGRMVTFKNITGQRLAENAKQEFVAHVAHELLTPLTNIKSYSEMLMDGEVSDTEMQKEFCNTINEQTDRLTDLVRNLLNISKMEMGSLTVAKDMMRSDWLFDGCLQAVEGQAAEKNIRIIRQPPDNFPYLNADKEMIKAAVINIIGNAVKYTPQGGSVTFGIGEQGERVYIDVTDTGYGISEEDLSRVFDKFYRSQDANITNQAGSGLGLAIAAEIVRLHDGDIKVQSQIGKGSHFSIVLPKETYRLERT